MAEVESFLQTMALIYAPALTDVESWPLTYRQDFKGAFLPHYKHAIRTGPQRPDPLELTEAEIQRAYVRRCVYVLRLKISHEWRAAADSISCVAMMAVRCIR